MSQDNYDQNAASFNLFTNEEPQANAPQKPTELERYASIAAELLKCKDGWINAPGRASARFSAKAARKAQRIEIGEILDALFTGGMPRDLTILPDIAVIPGTALRPTCARFLIACPITSSAGQTLGVIALADSKPRKLTAVQVDAFRNLTALAAAEIERMRPPDSRYEAAPGAPQAAYSASGFLSSCRFTAWLVDADTNTIVEASEAAAANFGYSPGEMAGMKVDSLLRYSNEDKDEVTGEGVMTARRGTVVPSEGVPIDVDVVSMDFAGSERMVRLDIISDTTYWRRLEDISRFQSSVLGQINEAVIAVDLNFRITHWNHVAEQMYDWRATEVLGEKLPDILQPLWKDVREERDASTALLAQGSWTGEAVQHRRSGEAIYIESSVTAIKNAENRHVGFLCLNRDITEHKKMEMSLLEGEQRYRSLFDFHPDAVVWIDLDGRLLSANLACMTILGYMPDELVGKSFLTGVDPKHRVRVLEMFEKATHGEPVSYEYTGLRRSGRKVSLAAVALPVIIDGRIVGVYAISQDIGERKRLQELIAGENEVLQWLAAGKPLRVVVERMVANIEKRYDWLKAGVIVFGDERSPDAVMAVGDMANALMKDGLAPRRTTIGKAIRSKKRVVCPNLQEDLEAADQTEIAVRLGIRACCTTPILGADGEVSGTFTIHLSESRRPSAEELNLADRAATLLRIAIETDRAHLKLNLTERAMDSTVASVLILDPNKPNRPIIYVNAAFERITGYRSGEIIGRSMSVLHGPDTSAAQIDDIERAITQERECNVLLKYYTAEGNPYWSSTSISPVRDLSGRLTHFIAVQNDVTPLMDALDAVRESEQRFRQLIENASDMILVLEKDAIVRYVSPAVTRILGYQPEEVHGRDVFEFIHPDELASARSLFLKMLETSDELITFELRIQRKDGAMNLLEATCQNLLGKPGVRGIVINARDLTERKQASERLDHLAYHDVLTDLPNRLLFNDHLAKAIAAAKRRGGMIAVLFLDIDRFKIINDTLGHSVGDELLQHVAQRLQATAKEGDIIAHWGGDEFTMILTGVSNSRDAARTAQRIINRLSDAFHVSGHELYITATAGISMYPAGGGDVEVLVRNADTAMYRAKETGQNHYQFYTPKMNAGASERLALEGRLRRALEREEFVLHYQPQVDRTGKIVSAEVLVRWQHPGLGLVSPKDFIPLAEETGLIVPIGDWIMKQACRQVRAWHNEGYEDLRVAVNVSARQFAQRDLEQMVTRVLKETGVEPSWLELELTESLLIGGENRIISAMKDLSSIGISFAIDDFGVGYSSYSYLKRYPVSSIKIEQSFVRGMLVDAHDNAIIQSILAMAHKLDLKVVAEGVETKAQADALHAAQCHILQGYFYGRPVPAPDFAKMLEGQREGIEI